MTNNDELALKTRKDFEAYYNETHALKATSQFKRFGYYVSPTMQKAWELWQAAQSSLLAERDADKKRIEMLEGANTSQDDHINQQQDRIDALEQRNSELGKYAGKLESISAAAEKLVRCKGRYHSEQNYRALAELFGVKTPDLPPLETEARTVSVKLPENIPCHTAPELIWLQTNGDDGPESSWPENSNDVSWCWEKMFHNDTLYVRADLAAGIKLEVGE